MAQMSDICHVSPFEAALGFLEVSRNELDVFPEVLGSRMFVE